MKKLGKWSLIKKLGSGAFAEVWLATGPTRKDAPLVALKLVHSHLAGDPSFLQLLKEEAWAASLLSHPNVVEIYEVSTAEGRPYLAMEFIPGQSLNAVQRKLEQVGEKFSAEEAAYAINQAALGLHYAHEARSPQGEALGLVHRDISPHNLIASDDGRVKVVDFGLARLEREQQTKNEEMEGKMAYMPPEQIRGERVDRRVDTFALGACLWELLAGRKMYPGKGAAELLQQALIQPPPDPRLVFAHLPVKLADVIGKAVAREKEGRFQTALELAEALEPFITDDAADKLARRIQSHFEFMPRTKEEAMGLDRPSGPRRRATVSSSKVPAQHAAKRTTGPKKKVAAKRDADEPRRGRRWALLLVLLLPLAAVGVLAGSGFVKNVKLPPVPELPKLPGFGAGDQAPMQPIGEFEDAGSDEVDAGTLVDTPKKKPAKKKAPDAGSRAP